MQVGPYDTLPDVRDGLTRIQRVVMYELSSAAKELGRDNVPTALLYGRVVERIDMSVEELQAILRSLGVADGNQVISPKKP